MRIIVGAENSEVLPAALLGCEEFLHRIRADKPEKTEVVHDQVET